MKAYPEYKNSGVEWLGEVPSHWSVPKISYLMNYLGSGTTPKSTNEEYYSGNTLWVTTGELREGIILDTKKKVSKLAIEDNSALKSHPVNSIVMAMYGATIGRLARLGVEATTNQACCVLPPSEKIDTDFLYYWLMCHREEIIELGYGGGQPNISQDTVANLKVSLPSSYEQSKIVDFLDIKIGHVDNLISEKQSFIKLLQEKRQALISHVVTKGLNPNVPMKDSGVEWIGEIPEHWEIKSIKHIATCNDDVISESTPIDSVIQYVDIGSVSKLEGITSKETMTFGDAPSRARRMVKDGDIIISTVRTYLEAIAPIVSPEKNLVVSTGFAVIRPRHIDSKFSQYSLRARHLIHQVSVESNGISYPAINSSSLMNLKVVVPKSNTEQKAIASYIEDKLTKLDKITIETNKSIDFLKEHRTALISAAVTGKIDVREAM